MPKATETVMEIDLRALTHNFNYLRNRIRKDTRFMAVVKAFAYGSEAGAIARHLESLGADYFAVAYAREGAALRDAGVRAPIKVLHPQAENLELLIERCLEPALYSKAILEDFLAVAKRHGQNSYPVHLKFNTGLNRLGFHPDEAGALGTQLGRLKALEVRSLFSHLAASEDPAEQAFTQYQVAHYETLYEAFASAYGKRPLRHLMNTSGILNYPDSQYDMVRSGIGLYGFGNEASIDQELQPIACLKTVISQIHEVAAGESVGYNRAFMAPGKRRSATLPLGHADGIGRIYGKGKGFVYVHGKKAPILGNVCMDMIMVDVTDIDCQEGDEVVVFGPNASAEALAKAGGTISYELITGISQRVKRVILS